MGLDMKQVVAAVLTLTMFVMLANMIKRDHFDPEVIFSHILLIYPFVDFSYFAFYYSFSFS